MRAKPLRHVHLSVTPWAEGARLLRPWDSPGKNTGLDCHVLPQGIFPTQESNPRLLFPALAGGLFTTSATWEAHLEVQVLLKRM